MTMLKTDIDKEIKDLAAQDTTGQHPQDEEFNPDVLKGKQPFSLNGEPDFSDDQINVIRPNDYQVYLRRRVIILNWRRKLRLMSTSLRRESIIMKHGLI
jgi:hypothetical protein